MIIMMMIIIMVKERVVKPYHGEDNSTGSSNTNKT